MPRPTARPLPELTSAPKGEVLYAAAMNEPSRAELDNLTAQATVDCYSEDEELTDSPR
jgi:hypothetical protein